MRKFIEKMFKITQSDGMDAEAFCWAVFPAKWDDDKIFDFIDWVDYRYDMNIGISRNRYHNGAGQAYCDSPSIIRSKTRALIIQRHAYDV
mgnify:FL=1|tara:strand:+ start:18552 stop:18821 length:270 start_codon:yes stop_codon:yes gene_type:complete